MNYESAMWFGFGCLWAYVLIIVFEKIKSIAHSWRQPPIQAEDESPWQAYNPHRGDEWREEAVAELYRSIVIEDAKPEEERPIEL